MAFKKVGLIFTFCLILLLAACEGEQIPTPLPSAQLPTPILPTATSLLPPTTDLTAVATEPAPTAIIMEASDTPSPTLPAASPTPLPSGISITSPDEGVDILMGSDIIARGLVNLEPTQTAWLSLFSYNGRLLAESQANVSDFSWESGVRVPQSISGAAILQATIRNNAGEIVAGDQIPVHLALNTESNDRYLALFRPVTGDPAMGGFNLFFDGRAQQPVNNTVTISVWSDNCQTQVANQSFVLSGSGYWQGFVIIPHTVSGPGCAIAHFGTPGEENWREAQIPITIFANDDATAKGISIGNPPPDSRITAGQELLLYGTALNASEASLQVTVLLENGRIVSDNSILTDFWGYWEFPLLLPVDVEGPAIITVSSGDPAAENYAQDQTLITIDSAPTPTP